MRSYCHKAPVQIWFSWPWVSCCCRPQRSNIRLVTFCTHYIFDKLNKSVTKNTVTFSSQKLSMCSNISVFSLQQPFFCSNCFQVSYKNVQICLSCRLCSIWRVLLTKVQLYLLWSQRTDSELLLYILPALSSSATASNLYNKSCTSHHMQYVKCVRIGCVSPPTSWTK